MNPVGKLIAAFGEDNVAVRFLIRNGLSGVITAIKRSGIKKLIFKQGSQLTIPEADVEKAKAYLAASTKWYNERFNTPDRSAA